MGVDFEALKARLRKMEDEAAGRKGGQDAKPKWNPPEGKTEIRVVPMSLTDSYDPITTLKLIYQIKVNKWNHTIVSLKANFDKADPFAELQSSLFQQGTEDAKELAKKLFPKDAHFMPVIVRGEEDKGVRWWGFSKTIYKDLMDKFFDKRWGVFTDPENGRDITVTRILKSGKESYDTIKADLSPVQSPLSDDQDEMEDWVNSIPDIHDVYPVKSYDELEKLVNVWFASNQNVSSEEVVDSGVDYSSGAAAKEKEETKEDGAFDNIDDAFDQILNDE